MNEISFAILIVKGKIIGCRTKEKEGKGRIADSPGNPSPERGNYPRLIEIMYFLGESDPDLALKGL